MKRRPEMVSLLRELVVAESPSTDPGAQVAVRGILSRQLSALDFHVRQIPSSGAVPILARPKRRERRVPMQLLVGHLDTVWPVGTLASMPLVQMDGRLAGPGAYDMKGGLVQAIFALQALRALALHPSVTPVLFINGDEEIGSPTSLRWIRRLARLAIRAFVLEPSFGPRGALKTSRKGVGRFTVRARGRAAHAGIDPGAGVSAILDLSHQIQRLFALNDPDRGITVNVGTIDGGLRPNVVAPEPWADVDVRVPTVADGRRVEAAIRGLTPVLPGIALEVEGAIERPPMEPNARNTTLWEAAREQARTLEMEIEPASVGGASEGNITSIYTATLDGLGAVGDGAHAAHEYVNEAHLAERAALLALLLLMPAATSDSGRTP
jgi:glutamate carboxypeptidase